MSEKSIRSICVMGATMEASNLGVHALTHGAVECLSRRFPRAKISFQDYGKEPRTQWLLSRGRMSESFSVLNLRFSKKILQTNNIAYLLLLVVASHIIPSPRLRKVLLSKNEFLRELQEKDLFFSLAGGDSFSDIYGLSRFFYISLPLFLILLLKKDLVLLPQTIGPFKRRSVRFLAGIILKKSKLNLTRDVDGIDSLARIFTQSSIPQKTRFCHDLAFYLSPQTPKDTAELDGLLKHKGSSRIIGFNVSGLLYQGGYTRNNMFRLKTNYADLVNDLLDALLQMEENQIYLIPHMLPKRQSDESDQAVCRKIAEEKKHPRLHNIMGNYHCREIKHIIGCCDIFLGSRMHACIAALSQAVPAIGIAYSSKFLSVMRSVGMEDLVVDPRSLDQQDMMTRIRSLLSQQKTYQEKLQKTVPHIVEKIDGIWRKIPFERNGPWESPS